MTIAVPICQNRVSPVLDSAARLLLVSRRRGREVGRRQVVLDAQPLEVLAGSIAELSVDVLLCAAVSEPLRRELTRRGIRVRAHLCGDVEEILEAFCSRRLGKDDFLMPGCWERLTREPASAKPQSRSARFFHPDSLPGPNEDFAADKAGRLRQRRKLRRGP